MSLSVSCSDLGLQGFCTCPKPQFSLFCIKLILQNPTGCQLWRNRQSRTVRSGWFCWCLAVQVLLFSLFCCCSILGCAELPNSPSHSLPERFGKCFKQCGHTSSAKPLGSSITSNSEHSFGSESPCPKPAQSPSRAQLAAPVMSWGQHKG